MLAHHRAKLQIRLVLVPLQTEAGRADPRNLPDMLDRARRILAALEPSVRGDPELEEMWRAALEQVDALAGGTRQQPIDASE